MTATVEPVGARHYPEATAVAASRHRRPAARRSGNRTCALVALAAAIGALPSAAWAATAAAPSWTPAAAITGARSGHTATDLRNGNVLVAGGFGTAPGLPPRAMALLFDPVRGAWTSTGAMAAPRGQHTATLLPDGRVLVAGGVTTIGHGQAVTKTAELYDPSTGTWSAAASMNTARARHTATLLPSGKILVAGGENSRSNSVGVSLTSAELYDPSVNMWTVTGSLRAGRTAHTATLLPSGNVLAVGGYKGFAFDPPSSSDNMAPPELYDPAAGMWRRAADNAIHRWLHTAVVLSTGLVLVTGGFAANVVPGQTPPENSSELYDPAGMDPTSGLPGHWSGTGSLGVPRAQHVATLLPGGSVLVEGGLDISLNAIASSEIWDPQTGHWTDSGTMGTPRTAQTATLLSAAACGARCGAVLVVGGAANAPGLQGGVPTATTELFTPAPPAGGGVKSIVIPPPATGVGDSTLIGLLLVVGGLMAAAAARRVAATPLG